MNSQDDKDATIAFDGTNFLVVWQHLVMGAGYLNCGVFVSPGGAVGSLFAIAQTSSAAWNLVGEVFDGTNYLVAHNAGGGGTSGYKPFYGRFVTPVGTFPGNEFVIITNGNPRVPVLAFDGADYPLCWNTNMGNADFVATNTDVRFQFLNGAGQPVGSQSLSEKGARLCRRPAAACRKLFNVPGIQCLLRLVGDDTAALRDFQTGSQFTPFSPQGSQVPLVALVLFDGKRFASVATLSAGGFTPPAYGAGVHGAFIPSSTAPPQLTAIIYTNKPGLYT